jgi:molybdopterin biosynthesis enzyme MoaB
VMRMENDGKYSLVYETNSVPLINAALEQAGKEQSKTSLLKDAETQREKNVCDSLQAVNEAVEHASEA